MYIIGLPRSALPTGPCGSSTPSLHDAINIVALAIEMARSHIVDALGVLVISEDIRSGLTACMTDSIGTHLRGWRAIQDCERQEDHDSR
jgi:hypothetical protein